MSTSKDSRSKRAGTFGLFFGFAVSALFLWLFLRNVDWSDLGQALSGVDLRTLGLCLIAITFVYALRGLRWAVLLHPVAKVSFRQSLSALLIGFGANCVLPARAGEFIRAAALAARTPVRWSTAFATIVVERVIDVIGILVILAYVLSRLPGEQSLRDPYGLVPRLHSFAWLFGVAVAGAFFVLLLMALRPTWVTRAVRCITKPLPEGLQGRLLGLVDSFCQGLHVVRSLRWLLLAQALTFLVWFGAAAVGWFLFEAFDLPANWTAALLVFVATAAAVALPQAPSFIGVYHVACEAALGLFGVTGAVAKGYAIVLWAIMVLPVFLAGVFCLYLDGLSLASLREASARATEHAGRQEGEACS